MLLFKQGQNFSELSELFIDNHVCPPNFGSNNLPQFSAGYPMLKYSNHIESTLFQACLDNGIPCIITESDPRLDMQD